MPKSATTPRSCPPSPAGPPLSIRNRFVGFHVTVPHAPGVHEVKPRGGVREKLEQPPARHAAGFVLEETFERTGGPLHRDDHVPRADPEGVHMDDVRVVHLPEQFQAANLVVRQRPAAGGELDRAGPSAGGRGGPDGPRPARPQRLAEGVTVRGVGTHLRRQSIAAVGVRGDGGVPELQDARSLSQKMVPLVRGEVRRGGEPGRVRTAGLLPPRQQADGRLFGGGRHGASDGRCSANAIFASRYLRRTVRTVTPSRSAASRSLIAA